MLQNFLNIFDNKIKNQKKLKFTLDKSKKDFYTKIHGSNKL